MWTGGCGFKTHESCIICWFCVCIFCVFFIVVVTMLLDAYCNCINGNCFPYDFASFIRVVYRKIYLLPFCTMVLHGWMDNIFLFTSKNNPFRFQNRHMNYSFALDAHTMRHCFSESHFVECLIAFWWITNVLWYIYSALTRAQMI